jgi:hypothetical protein
MVPEQVFRVWARQQIAARLAAHDREHDRRKAHIAKVYAALRATGWCV